MERKVQQSWRPRRAIRMQGWGKPKVWTISRRAEAEVRCLGSFQEDVPEVADWTWRHPEEGWWVRQTCAAAHANFMSYIWLICNICSKTADFYLLLQSLLATCLCTSRPGGWGWGGIIRLMRCVCTLNSVLLHSQGGCPGREPCYWQACSLQDPRLHHGYSFGELWQLDQQVQNYARGVRV